MTEWFLTKQTDLQYVPLGLQRGRGRGGAGGGEGEAQGEGKGIRYLVSRMNYRVTGKTDFEVKRNLQKLTMYLCLLGVSWPYVRKCMELERDNCSPERKKTATRVGSSLAIYRRTDFASFTDGTFYEI